MAIAGRPGGPLCTSSQPHPGDGERRGLPEAVQSAVNSQGSCFLSSCHSLFLSGEQRGTAPAPFSLPPPGMRITEERSSDRGSLFPAFLFLLLFLNQNHVRSQSVLLPQVPKRGPPHRALQPDTCRLPAPEQPLLSSVALCHLPGPTPPQFSDRVQEFVGLFSPAAVVTQSVSLQSLRL